MQLKNGIETGVILVKLLVLLLPFRAECLLESIGIFPSPLSRQKAGRNDKLHCLGIYQLRT